MSAREKLVSRVMRALGLRDLTPMPMLVLDPILDETIAEVVETLRSYEHPTWDCYELRVAADFVEREFSRPRLPA